MDYSGNVPQIITYNIGEGWFDVIAEDRDQPGIIYFTDDGNRIARIDVTGLITKPNIYQESGNREYCTGIKYVN